MPPRALKRTMANRPATTAPTSRVELSGVRRPAVEGGRGVVGSSGPSAAGTRDAGLRTPTGLSPSPALPSAPALLEGRGAAPRQRPRGRFAEGGRGPQVRDLPRVSAGPGRGQVWNVGRESESIGVSKPAGEGGSDS